jgi:hypothetical protein
VIAHIASSVPQNELGWFFFVFVGCFVGCSFRPSLPTCGVLVWVYKTSLCALLPLLFRADPFPCVRSFRLYVLAKRDLSPVIETKKKHIYIYIHIYTVHDGGRSDVLSLCECDPLGALMGPPRGLMGPVGLIHTWTIRPTIRASWSTKGPQRVPPLGPVGLMGPPRGVFYHVSCSIRDLRL